MNKKQEKITALIKCKLEPFGFRVSTWSKDMSVFPEPEVVMFIEMSKKINDKMTYEVTKQIQKRHIETMDNVAHFAHSVASQTVDDYWENSLPYLKNNYE